MRVLSPDEIRHLLESCPLALGLIARTTLESLPRLSEVLNLRIEDLGPSYATIVQTKSGKSRRVPLTSTEGRAPQAGAQERLHLRPRQRRQAAAAGGGQRGVRSPDARYRPGRRHTSRPAAHGRLGNGCGGDLLARRAGYRRLVNVANARTLRTSERRGDVARGTRADGLHDRHKNRHSDEKRERRFEDRRRRKWCEEWSYEVASPMPASWNHVTTWLRQIDALRRAA